MDERCQKFAADASARPTDAKAIATLRKFLYRNQEQRLTSGASQALCDAVVRHAASASASASGGGGKGDEDAAAAAPAVALLEDALAMPFNIFSTGHKRQMLKHLDRLRGVGGGAAAAATAAAADGSGASASPAAARECAVLEAAPGGSLELMDDDGETAVCPAGAGVSEEEWAEIRRALDAGDDVRVRAVFSTAAAAGGGKSGGGKKGGGGRGAQGAEMTARVLGIVGR